MSLFPPDTLGEHIERINGDPSREPFDDDDSEDMGSEIAEYCRAIGTLPQSTRPCSICGDAPCESPSACRSQASFECDPGHAGEYASVDDFEEESECRF